MPFNAQHLRKEKKMSIRKSVYIIQELESGEEIKVCKKNCIYSFQFIAKLKKRRYLQQREKPQYEVEREEM
jgi:hypothetical protein